MLSNPTTRMQTETPLPRGTVFLVFIISLVGMMTPTMILSYQPKLLRHLHISEVNIGYHAGLLSGACYLSKTICSVFWGMLSDSVGRKEALLLVISTTAFSTLLFGFTVTFEWALVVRCIQGMSYAVIVCSKAYITELCDDTNTIRAMSLVMASTTAALIIGPSFGALLVFPTEQYPKVFPQNGIFDKYPILLPNLIVSGLLVILATLGLRYLPRPEGTVKKKKYEEKNPISMKDRILTSNFFRLLRNKLAICCSFLYAWVHYNVAGFSEVFSLYTATTYEYKGLEFTPTNIGTSLLVVSVVTTIGQLSFLPKIAKKIGPKKTYIVAMVANALGQPILPLAHLCHSSASVWAVVISQLLICRLGFSACMLSSNVMVTNSVPRRELGIVNGFSSAVNGFLRIISVTSMASLYSWSLTNIKGIETNLHPLGFPFNEYFVFFVLSLSGILAAMATSLISDSVNRRYEEVVKT